MIDTTSDSERPVFNKLNDIPSVYAAGGVVYQL